MFSGLNNILPNSIKYKLFNNSTVRKHVLRLLRYSNTKVSNTAIIKDSVNKSGKERFLLFARVDTGLNTVSENITELIALSEYPIDWISIKAFECLDKDFRFYDYDGIIIHGSICFSVEKLELITANCKQKFSDYKGIKIMIKQDEWYKPYQRVEYLEKNPFDMIVTICSSDMIEKFYPSEKLPNISFLTYMTAYVKESNRYLPYHDIRNRKIDVGYRGWEWPPNHGRLLYEKTQIGREFKIYADKRRIVTDISGARSDLITGDDWYEFLGDCKAVLGVESGVSVVDIDGTIEAGLNKFLKKHRKATDEEILDYLSEYENGPQYRAIAPRHLEAAACFTVQVMYEGDFQGIFKKNEHYICLNRDFSNVNEVIDRILDDNERKRITENAYRDIIMNDNYSYKSFVKRFDKAIGTLLEGVDNRIIFD